MYVIHKVVFITKYCCSSFICSTHSDEVCNVSFHPAFLFNILAREILDRIRVFAAESGDHGVSDGFRENQQREGSDGREEHREYLKKGRLYIP